MGLLQPEVGLVFWMGLSFLIVLTLLAKFGFPIIVRSLEERKEFIDGSLRAAHEAEERLAALHAEVEAGRAAALEERTAMMREAAAKREELLAAARQEATAEGSRLLAEARVRAEQERAALLADARRQVALVAVNISERLLREQLDHADEQTRLAERLFDETAAAKMPTDQRQPS